MKKFLLPILLIMMFVPFVANADTWLDDPSYRNLDWFDENTYDISSTYLIDSAEKMAGLIYLVNEKGYTFEDKVIKIKGNYHDSSCYFIDRVLCGLDMTAHEWVTLKDNFNGTIYDGYNNGTGWYSTYIYAKTDKNKINFSENNTCKVKKSDGSNTELSCNKFLHVQYNIYTNSSIGGTIEAPLKETSTNGSTSVTLKPNEGYYIDKVVIKDVDNNTIFEETIFDYINRDIRFKMPDSIAYIDATFKKRPNNKCTALSGNGKIIGDEIVCGDEHFYVIFSNSNEIKMLAKYNLFAGEIIYKEKIKRKTEDSRTDTEYCEDLAESKGGILKHESVYEVPGYCFVAIPIKEIMMKQSSEAISAHWDKDGNYLYPQVGDVYIKGYDSYNSGQFSNSWDFTVIDDSSSKYNGYFYDLNLGNYQIREILNSYNHYLTLNNAVIKDINLMTLDDINSIVKENNKTIPYEEWYNSSGSIQPPRYEFAFLNDYLTKKQSFLYNTTYWIRTGYDRTTQSPLGVNNVVFIDSFGGVCSGGLSLTQTTFCGYLLSNVNSQIGCGIRPVITISVNELQYLIKTETDGYGTIEVVENSLGGETIQFKVSANKGYKLGSIVITTDSGETVEFSEGEIIKNDDGTFSIDKNKFTMPFENVTIQAKFESENILKNPETGNKVLFIILILVASIGIRIFIYKKKESRYNV